MMIQFILLNGDALLPGRLRVWLTGSGGQSVGWIAIW